MIVLTIYNQLWYCSNWLVWLRLYSLFLKLWNWPALYQNDLQLSFNYRDVKVQILIWFQTFLLFTKPHYQTFNALKSTSFQAFQTFSDFFSQMPAHPWNLPQKLQDFLWTYMYNKYLWFALDLHQNTWDLTWIYKKLLATTTSNFCVKNFDHITSKQACIWPF